MATRTSGPRASSKIACSLCKTLVDRRKLVSPQKMENHVLDIIRHERPEWDGTHGVCGDCVDQYRAKKFLSYLEAEYRKITDMEQALVSKIARGGRVARLVDQEFEARMTLGQRVADKVARFGGSWPFIFLFGGVLLGWMVLNTWVLARHPFDPYPYIFLNLALSALAALQAPVIMMSQNRQDTKDRLRGELDFDVNRRAEAEVQGLSRKLNVLAEKMDDIEELLRRKGSA
jgi:uncharacterized membrane protein